MHEKKSVELPVEQATTLLPFLLERVQNKSRNAIKALLTRRQVLVDSTPVTRFDHPLLPGQRVMLLPASAAQARIPFPVLYEDADLLVIDKPAGLLSIADDRERERTAYHMATDYVRASDSGSRLFIVHRLDRDTSGVLLFAKQEALKRALQSNWDTLVQRREYLAAVEGTPPEPSGLCRSWLRETAGHRVYSGRPGTGAKEAITHYDTLAQARGLTLLRVRLDTGRKNQIRVHMADLGCPVSGDKKYGSGSGPLRRLALHASTLALAHPLTGAPLLFQAPAPLEFRRAFPSWEGVLC